MRFEHELVGEVAVITPRRERDDEANHLVAIKAEVVRLIAGGRRVVVLDMHEIDFMNSTAVGALIGSAAALQQKLGVLVLCGLGLRMVETLQVIGVLRRLIFRIERREAVAAVARFVGTESAHQQLQRDNPSIDRVRLWWKKAEGERAAADGRQDPTMMESTVGDHMAAIPPGTTVHAARAPAAEKPAPPAPPAKEGAQEWYEAMRLLATAKQLARRAGFQFRAEMTFQQFLSELADHLGER